MIEWIFLNFRSDRFTNITIKNKALGMKTNTIVVIGRAVSVYAKPPLIPSDFIV